MSEPVPLVLIGCGHQGRYHLRHLQTLSGAARLVAVIDPDPAAREAAGEGVSTFADLASYVESGVDAARAAVVAVPTPLHAEVGCACLAEGWSVLLEKPLAGSFGDARRLVSAAEGRLLRVGHIERFNPAVRAAEERIGVPLFVEGHRLGPFRERMDLVDVVLDLMIHDLDLLLRWTGGQVTEVRAAGARVLTEKVDIANVRLQFDTGCVANLTASRASLEQMRKLRVFADDRYVSVDMARHSVQVLRREAGEAGAAPRIVDDSPEVDAEADALAEQLATFLEEVQAHDGGAPLSSSRLATPEQAAAALELALQIREAVEAHARRLGVSGA